MAGKKSEDTSIENENSGEGRTVIIRGVKGEVLLSSTNTSDKLKGMVSVALDAYERETSPSMVG